MLMSWKEKVRSAARRPLGAQLLRAGLAASALQVGAIAAGEAMADEPVTDDTAAEAQSAAGLATVMVTAERRTENAQKIPIAMSTFSDSFVETNHLQSIQDLVPNVAGLGLLSFGKSRTIVALRGAANPLGAPGAENAVAVYIDDVYFGGAGDLEFDMFNIERIEVLRGPQGTLIGRNSSGGSINIITKTPTQETEGAMEVTVGSDDLVQSKGFVSGALPGSESVFGSLAFTHTDSDGLVYNRFSDTRVDSSNKSSAQGSLRWEITQNTSLTLRADVTTKDEANVARNYVGAPPSAASLAEMGYVPDDDPFVVDSYLFDGGRFRMHAAGGSAKVDYRNEHGTFTSLTSYRGMKSDPDFEENLGLPTPTSGFTEARDKTQVTQELRWVSEVNGGLSWIGGLYALYSQEIRDEKWVFTFDTNTFGGALQASAGCGELQGEEVNFAVPECVAAHPELFDTHYVFGRQDSDVYSFAPYLQVHYNFEERMGLPLGLTVGGRYTRDKKTGKGNKVAVFANGEPSVNWLFVPGGAYEIDKVERTWSAFTPKATMDWTISDGVMAYVTVAKGFRSGLFEFLGAVSEEEAALAVEPETVWNYEAGFKSRFWSNRAQLNVAVFDAEYDGLQFTVTTTDGGIASDNAGKATVKGVEVDFNVLPWDWLTVWGNYSYQDASTSEIPESAGIPDGTRPGMTPEHTLNIGFSTQWTLPGGATLGPYANYQYKEAYQTEMNPDPAFESEVKKLVNAGLLFTWPGEQLQLNIWGKNIFDEAIVLYGNDWRFMTYSFDEAYDPSSPSFNPAAATANMPRYYAPRTFGVSLKYSF